MCIHFAPKYSAMFILNRAHTLRKVVKNNGEGRTRNDEKKKHEIERKTKKREINSLPLYWLIYSILVRVIIFYFVCGQIALEVKPCVKKTMVIKLAPISVLSHKWSPVFYIHVVGLCSVFRFFRCCFCCTWAQRRWIWQLLLLYDFWFRLLS